MSYSNYILYVTTADKVTFLKILRIIFYNRNMIAISFQSNINTHNKHLHAFKRIIKFNRTNMSEVK